MSEEDFAEEGNIVQLGYEPVKVDILTSITGVSVNEVWKNRTTGTYGKEKIFIIGLKELIKNKKMTGRKQDLADLDLFE